MPSGVITPASSLSRFSLYCEEIVIQINNTVKKIESMELNQNALNEVYLEIKELFLKEMSKLPDITTNDKKARRQKRKSHKF